MKTTIARFDSSVKTMQKWKRNLTWDLIFLILESMTPLAKGRPPQIEIVPGNQKQKQNVPDKRVKFGIHRQISER